MESWKDNIYFILVEPIEPGNIGASARAIKNMGFKNLCLVNPPFLMTKEAKLFAYNALDILESAKIHKSLSDAISDKSIILGTTRRLGKARGIIFPVNEGINKIFDVINNNKVAILFGRENKGLLNEEIDECGFLLTIPTSKEHRSLNLSQAVLLVAYELSKAGDTDKNEGCTHDKLLVNHKKLDFLLDRISRTLDLLGYIPKGDDNLKERIMWNLKHFIGRAGIAEWELNMLHGICTQIEKKVKGE
ncbi:MAG: hypothetical protein A3C43_12290 [Candidatus Schekmanbacteria bacterium RIFCSPHIGHO2_02_FULL_38_11]|uniref:tRNA (cytidine/uridine-2'-O-)-methyltransferase TrmJ n=1 Tax=Candidatus Schekmanbacteria bacterium RIFCSPLOWO2_12_FULL_38_15 TaxID=1817883 RepID=A0A1F7SHY1_9BACT|nr:MAG: hypothetical protein A3H37_03435 [Candidatus Schekmanbacteria bacterium RIFCSPLOWO2_02_FULL_38_14]OGL53365.1 MAG: hypothetical protein A3G31_07630 [Candidatus Schekmanbacteria bacterium RIFCSPLOWO2_12_FULL_38_15]OGL55719.1 MAG: hypothetical protein A3C43_12290 [Candidatus Schekmanbacteria bacterium RIFCSPHIGHO2_02_FULL_38_11]